MRIPVFVFAALAAGVGNVCAQQSINQVVPTSPTGVVEISNLSGEVRVVGGSPSEIRITGTLGEGAERVAVETAGNRTTIRVIIPRSTRNARGTDLVIHLPERKEVHVTTTSADIAVERVAGGVTARSTSGDVEVTGSPQQVTASSTSGDVRISATTQRVQAKTTSGDVDLSGAVRGSAAAESVSGDVRVEAETPDLLVKSVSGDVEVGGTIGRISVGTVSGEAAIRARGIQYIAAESVSGGLAFDGQLQNRAAFNVKSHSGDVDLALPSNFRARFDVSTFSGAIANGFGPAAQRTSQYGPGQALQFSSGDGALITVKTFSGNVKLRQR